MELTHINENGRARMVDISTKDETNRVAIAQGIIRMQPETLQTIKTGGIKKGDVLGVAQVAGIMGAKQTAFIVPMCHPVMLTSVDIEFEYVDQESAIIARAIAKTSGKTGVEMEAIMAVSTALITIYDMCKAIDRWMVVSDIQLVEKAGGKSGHVIRGKENQ
ncbi:MAG: cyclic pyranopterin monophosphate synthase MoaC [Syntrophomonadaceae bacterium]|mgnify:CR=1 FL=1|nr:cyclic pyranopterin monophosphate synthase MoaC [Syntrophomonadaceae bacterium]